MLLNVQPRAGSARNSKRLPANSARVHSGSLAGSVGIVTMTLARSEEEARQLVTALRKLSTAGLSAWVGEGGSVPGFAERLEGLPGVRLCPLADGFRPTLVNQLRSAFAAALQSDCAWFLSTEPDKSAFFGRGLRTLADNPPEGPVPGLVLASRTPQGFSTFPEGQRIAEGMMNRICSEALGQEGDFTYGPMLISRRLARFVERIPESLGWGWRFFLMAVAHQLGLGVELRPIGSPCPRSQRGEDDARSREYRLKQLVQNVTGLANGWTFLLDPPLETIG